MSGTPARESWRTSSESEFDGLRDRSGDYGATARTGSLGPSKIGRVGSVISGATMVAIAKNMTATIGASASMSVDIVTLGLLAADNGGRSSGVKAGRDIREWDPVQFRRSRAPSLRAR